MRLCAALRARIRKVSACGPRVASPERRPRGRLLRCRARVVSAAPLLEAANVSKLYRLGGGLIGGGHTVHALTDVSLSLLAGETVAVVGESGCGKTTLARCLAQLIQPSSGTIRIDGEDVTEILRREPLRFRRRIQIVFQDPYASLN